MALQLFVTVIVDRFERSMRICSLLSTVSVLCIFHQRTNSLPREAQYTRWPSKVWNNFVFFFSLCAFNTKVFYVWVSWREVNDHERELTSHAHTHIRARARRRKLFQKIAHYPLICVGRGIGRSQKRRDLHYVHRPRDGQISSSDFGQSIDTNEYVMSKRVWSQFVRLPFFFFQKPF